MTDEQILKKAIEKAINNNWNFWRLVYKKDYYISIYDIDCLYCPCMQGTCKPEDCECRLFKNSDKIDIEIKLDDKKIAKFDKLNYKEIIFSHSFAKKFWGEEIYSFRNGNYAINKPRWEHHIQQLVLCENPLQYLKKFLD